VPSPRPAASIVPVLERAGAPARLLWARRADDASFLPGFHVVPGGTLVDADAAAPHDGGELVAARVGGLRELFEEVGILAAHGAHALSRETLADLRHRFQDDPGEGHARLAELGLVWQTRALVPIGRWVTPSFSPVRFDVQFFGYVVSNETPPDADLFELREAEWIEAPEALGRWSRAEALIGPPLAAVLRSLARHGRLVPDELRQVYGARGEETLRWEVAPFVQVLPLRTPTLPPATHTNAVLVGSGDAVLIEPATPYPEELERAVAWVEEARRAGTHVRALLVTHHHPDHVGGARALSERLRLPLWGHALTAERLKGELTFDRLLEDGERIVLDGPEPLVLRAIHTPGHAPGHLCFLEERSRVMVAGDMVAAVGTILVEPGDGDMAEYLRSLERMAAEKPSVLVPAHGGPLRDPEAVLAHYVRHRLDRERRIYDALVGYGGAATPLDLLPVAYADAPRAAWPLAALSTEAHLLKLSAEGRVRRTAGRWEVIERPPLGP
jgi:glyoxylase-like metal-dependent hydrolase (beta-lactamase superfamily II)